MPATHGSGAGQCEARPKSYACIEDGGCALRRGAVGRLAPARAEFLESKDFHEDGETDCDRIDRGVLPCGSRGARADFLPRECADAESPGGWRFPAVVFR